MRMYLAIIGLLAACSNAADPFAPDAMLTGDSRNLDTSDELLDILRINEVAASENPDWIEVVNHTSAPVEMSEFCYTDTPDDPAKCKAFVPMSLAPGAYFAQDIDPLVTGFKLGSDEAAWIYRIADHRVSDTVDWNDGDSPEGSSFARIPDVTGSFATTNRPTKDAPNLATDPNAPLHTLVINEVAASDDPDWLEVVNVTSAPIEMSDYCYIDTSTAPCHPFPAGPLAPGAYLAVDASASVSGFAFASDEAAYVMRISDGHISDSVDWADGDAGPAGSSFARHPDKTGAFENTSSPTRGAKNH